MHSSITRSDIYDYLLFLPRDYKSGKKWPAILYLHGVGAKGDYLELLKANGLPQFLEGREDFPFLVFSPQCPASEDWSPDILNRLIDAMIYEYEIDPDRVYLTGIGEGASAAWKLAAGRAERFAAVAPVCGGGDVHEACLLRDLPVWIFHGARDRIVPISEAQGMALALKLCGGNVNFTIYPEAGHDSWSATYGNPELYSWFLEQSRSRFSEPALDPVAEHID